MAIPCIIGRRLPCHDSRREFVRFGIVVFKLAMRLSAFVRALECADKERKEWSYCRDAGCYYNDIDLETRLHQYLKLRVQMTMIRAMRQCLVNESKYLRIPYD